jgi:hypothetical protein
VCDLHPGVGVLSEMEQQACIYFTHPLFNGFCLKVWPGRLEAFKVFLEIVRNLKKFS